MSTDTITGPTVTQTAPDGRRKRIALRLAGTLAGLAALGGLLLAGAGGNSTSPGPTLTPARSQPALAPVSEVFPGCLNDIECNGEPSHLPPGYWDLPTIAAVD